MDFGKFKDVFDSAGGLDGLKKGAKSVSSFLKSKKSDTTTAENAEDASSPDATGFSPELERLIAMVLADDNVTDYELEKLAERAQKEGIDPFEFEMVIKTRLRKKKEEAERLKNPVSCMDEAFKMAEAAAKGGKAAVETGALSSVLSMIPGVGQAAAVGTLAASLIKTPSNLNALKAEIINSAIIPDDERLLADFMLFCQAQRETDFAKKNSSSNSLSGILSSVTVGSSLDLEPIWNNKISQLISRAAALYPQSDLIRTTIAQVYESPATRLRKFKASGRDIIDLIETLSIPEDDAELLEVVAFLYENSNDEDVKEAHKNFYKVAERRFAGNPELSQKLKTYKIKKFGLF